MPGEEVLARAPIRRLVGEAVELRVTVNDNRLTATFGDVSMEADISGDPNGGVGLQTDAPAVFRDVMIQSSVAEHERLDAVNRERQEAIEAVARRLPRPTLWKVILTPDYGCDRNLRFGDLDGDGHDEIFVGYNLIDSDGTTIWSHDDLYSDHADAIAVVDLNGDGSREVLWAGSDEGLIWLTEDGVPRTHLRIGHTQNLTIAELRPESPGLEVAVINFWKNQGLLHILDAKGTVIESLEPRPDHGSAMPPVNWSGAGPELLFLGPDPVAGGLLDGHGRFVVRLTGDARDELIVWDSHEIWIYTQQQPPAADTVTTRSRNPRYNESNYRSRISVPIPPSRDGQRQ